mgnify:CR=1 FL=1
MEKKILVTGGMGYIGTHTVVELWKNGFTPIIIDNFSNSYEYLELNLNRVTQKQNKIYKVDCTNHKILAEVFKREKNILGIIHFAAHKSVDESITDPFKYYNNNMNTLFNVLELASLYDVPNFIFSSSCAVYGEQNQFPITEKTKQEEALSPYSHTKQLGELVVKQTALENLDLKAISLRYFNPIGAHPSSLLGEYGKMEAKNLLPNVISKALRGEPVTVYGNDYDTRDGSCIRDFVDVQDLAKAHVMTLQYLINQNEGIYDVINVGSGSGVSVLEMIHTIEQTLNKTLPMVINERRPGDIPAIYASIEKAKKLLGWSPMVSLHESIANQIKWHQYIDENIMLKYAS